MEGSAARPRWELRCGMHPWYSQPGAGVALAGSASPTGVTVCVGAAPLAGEAGDSCLPEQACAEHLCRPSSCSHCWLKRKWGKHGLVSEAGPGSPLRCRLKASNEPLPTAHWPPAFACAGPRLLIMTNRHTCRNQNLFPSDS